MKKIILSSLAITFLVFQVQAQKWVKTTPQNKNVILEEFTGIHCGYCPDGHKIANQLVAANPGRVFLINIHSGSFAVPSVGEPDFRTSAGDAIDAAAGITGYPSGSLNRKTSPWGQGRNLWASQASGIMAEASPVNVAIKSYIDYTTRDMVTEVEVYYTGASSQAKNYLTVALTEDDILGIQSDYGNYNPTNWVNGKYRHNHVLRQLLTAGNFGMALDTTTAGKYYYKKFVTNIPLDYKVVDVMFYKLNVVAFVSENANGSNILSGDGAAVDFDQSIKTDLSLTDLTVKPTGFCFSTINPKIEVTNNLDNTITDFEVTAVINGVNNTKTFNGSLAKGQKTTIDWGAVPFTPSGVYTLSFMGFDNINGGTLYDVETTNNSSAIFSSYAFKAKAFTTFKTSFETGMPTNMAFDNSVNPNFKIFTAGTTNYGNFNTKTAVLFYLHSSWGMSGKPGHIYLGEADFTGYTTDPGIGYYYAYSDGGQGGTAPTIDINVSDNCGQTWTKVSSVTAIETGQPTDPAKIYDPKQYFYVKTSLAAYKGKSVLIKMTGTPGTNGNALLIDEINVTTNAKLSVADEVKTIAGVTLSPNPVNGSATVNYELVNSGDVTFNVYNMLNQLVYTKTVTSANGINVESFDFSTFSSGVYTLTVATGDAVTTKKFVKN